MVDHVKKSGIGHFVNMLIWAGLADQGNKVLKYFCLDIDRSNHSAKDCAAAAAIKMSINTLKMADINTSEIEVFVITVDAGVVVALSSTYILCLCR